MWAWESIVSGGLGDDHSGHYLKDAGKAVDDSCGRDTIFCMVRISFKDRASERRAIGFLLGRFSGRVLKGGEHLVPEAALEALAEENIAFNVKGKASYEQQVEAIRGSAAAPIQRRPRRSPRVAGGRGV